VILIHCQQCYRIDPITRAEFGTSLKILKTRVKALWDLPGRQRWKAAYSPPPNAVLGGTAPQTRQDIRTKDPRYQYCAIIYYCKVSEECSHVRCRVSGSQPELDQGFPLHCRLFSLSTFYTNLTQQKCQMYVSNAQRGARAPDALAVDQYPTGASCRGTAVRK
jgi:hypothetical protein